MLSFTKIVVATATLCGAFLFSEAQSLADMDVGEARQIPYHGRLELDGTGVVGTVDFRFAFFATAEADASCLALPTPGSCGFWWEQQDSVMINSGTFSVVLGQVVNLQDHVFAQPALFLAIAVKDADATAFTLLTHKKRVYAVPFAARAAAAKNYEVVGDLTVGGNSALAGSLQVTGNSTLNNLQVDGDSTLKRNLQVDGRVGVGQAASSIANINVRNTADVGVFVGDRAPFGQALIETDVSTGRTHAYFAEAGNRVFSVTSGGAVTASGNVSSSGTVSGSSLSTSGDLVAGSNTRSSCAWTSYFSEENSAMTCSNNRYVAGAECSGSYCDAIRLYCCEL
jgi:hypothetical protein